MYMSNKCILFKEGGIVLFENLRKQKKVNIGLLKIISRITIYELHFYAQNS